MLHRFNVLYMYYTCHTKFNFHREFYVFSYMIFVKYELKQQKQSPKEAKMRLQPNQISSKESLL